MLVMYKTMDSKKMLQFILILKLESRLEHMLIVRKDVDNQ
jgi:hypothetical protein